MCKQSDNMCIPLYTIPQCDGQTNGQICHNNIMLCTHFNGDVQ